MNEGEAASPGVAGTGRGVGPAVHQHRSAIGPHGSGEDVHQGALARAVLSDQRVHLARLQREIHAVQRRGGPESFGDVVNFEQRAHGSAR